MNYKKESKKPYLLPYSIRYIVFWCNFSLPLSQKKIDMSVPSSILLIEMLLFFILVGEHNHLLNILCKFVGFFWTLNILWVLQMKWRTWFFLKFCFLFFIWNGMPCHPKKVIQHATSAKMQSELTLRVF